jgi:hypothetical protein
LGGISLYAKTTISENVDSKNRLNGRRICGEHKITGGHPDEINF